MGNNDSESGEAMTREQLEVLEKAITVCLEADQPPWSARTKARMALSEICADVLDSARLIKTARGQGRREGLEEAAAIALTEATQLDGLNERMAKGAERAAIAIRARINQEPII